MPKYQVLQPIEKNNVLYVAKGAAAAKSVPSACHGKLIPVDASGEIELTEEEASILIYGQVPLVPGQARPYRRRGSPGKEGQGRCGRGRRQSRSRKGRVRGIRGVQGREGGEEEVA